MSVTREARDGLRALVYVLTGRLQRKVSASEVLSGLQVLADRHPDELAAILQSTSE